METTGQAVVPIELPPPPTGLSVVLSSLRAQWAYGSSSVASLVVFFILFQPWMTASNDDGSGTVNAFGHIQRTSTHQNVWASSGPPMAYISSFWAIVATTAIVIGIFAAVTHARTRDVTTALVCAAAMTTIAFSVLMLVIYMSNKRSEFRGMLGRSSDAGGRIAQIVNSIVSHSPYPFPGSSTSEFGNASITSWAIVALIISLVSAAVVIVPLFRSGILRLPAMRSFTVTIGRVESALAAPGEPRRETPRPEES